ncbi:DUF6181 family protein [Streptomyces echinoruber]|uniref:Uncharacterized protein n=1 Tax=Streptomyces echinoruber TaxID=68898 RepID=A0A918RXD6_9ACTN|nr:DUF6181 family protein [Streptomyces echinoruber]GHA14890.1 hypothetical protein GCM10010389_62040 [Streptomyces echinoruber]
MQHTKEATETHSSPRRRGAAQPSKGDGVFRVAVPLRPRLSASELTRALLAARKSEDLDMLRPVQIRALIAEVLTRHGYDLLDRSAYDPHDPRHQAARRAVRRAYGSRFVGAPDEMRFLAEPLTEVFRDGFGHGRA